jgi:hypothetical protein
MAPSTRHLPEGNVWLLIGVLVAQFLSVLAILLLSMKRTMRFFGGSNEGNGEPVFWFCSATFIFLATGPQLASEGVDIFTMGQLGFMISAVGNAAALRYIHQAAFVTISCIISIAHAIAVPHGSALVNHCGAKSQAIVCMVCGVLAVAVAHNSERAAREQFLGEERRHLEESGLQGMVRCLLPTNYADAWIAVEKEEELRQVMELAETHPDGTALTIVWRSSGEGAELASGGALFQLLRERVAFMHKKVAKYPEFVCNASLGNCYQIWAAGDSATEEVVRFAVEVRATPRPVKPNDVDAQAFSSQL